MLAPLIFACAVASIHDGDSLTCRDGTKVRLAAVDAPEMRHCRRGRVCAPGNPHRSRKALVRMAAGKTLTCEKTGMSWGRVTAWCNAPGVGDLSCALLRGRWAVYKPEFDPKQRMCR